MTQSPVSVPPLPTAFKLPRFRQSVSAARARATEVPVGPTLIDEIDDATWLADHDDPIICGK